MVGSEVIVVRSLFRSQLHARPVVRSNEASVTCSRDYTQVGRGGINIWTWHTINLHTLIFLSGVLPVYIRPERQTRTPYVRRTAVVVFIIVMAPRRTKIHPLATTKPSLTKPTRRAPAP